MLILSPTNPDPPAASWMAQKAPRCLCQPPATLRLAAAAAGEGWGPRRGWGHGRAGARGHAAFGSGDKARLDIYGACGGTVGRAGLRDRWRVEQKGRQEWELNRLGISCPSLSPRPNAAGELGRLSPVVPPKRSVPRGGTEPHQLL